MMKRWIDRNVFGLFMLVVCAGGLVDKYQTGSQRGMAAWAVMLLLSMVALYRNYHQLKPKVLTPDEVKQLDRLGTRFLASHRPSSLEFFRRHPAAIPALNDAWPQLEAVGGAYYNLIERPGEDGLTVLIQAAKPKGELTANLGTFTIWWLSTPRPYPLCFEVESLNGRA